MNRWSAALIPLLVWVAAPAAAQVSPDEVPVIEPGREAEIVALFEPYELTREVERGWRLMNLQVESTHIVCDVRGPDDERASLRLDHVDHSDAPDATSASFGMRYDAPDDDARVALEALAEAVRRNDDGDFFRMHARPAATLGQRVFDRHLGRPLNWLVDGTLLSLLGLVVLLAFAARQLRREDRRYTWALVGITGIAAVVRLILAPATVLGAWPFSRTTTLMRHVWEGPALAAASAPLGPFDYFDVATTTTLIFSFATPVAVFAHARELLGNARVAIVAAGIVAILPDHIRFSQSEVAFIPSIVLSSTTFFVLHVAMKDPAAKVRWAALAALPVFALGTFLARPLNQLFLPLLLITALYLARQRAPWLRRALASVVLCAVAAATIALHFTVYYGDQVAEGLSLDVLWRGIGALFSFRHNTLINPWITPPLVLIAAGLGTWWTLRAEREDRDRALFVLLWLLAFFVTHAYVLPSAAAMQARYHLHLIVPFAFLAALGIVGVYERWPRWGIALAAYAALSPLVHADFIDDVAFNDQREYAFVREARNEIPEACTVLEYTGRGGHDFDARFPRVGAALQDMRETRRFVVQPIGAEPGSADPVRPEARELLESPPDCLFYYEGLMCLARREDDQPTARACAAVRDALDWEDVADARFDSRIYDGNLAPDGDESVELGLYRAR